LLGLGPRMTPLAPTGSIEGLSVASREGVVVLGEGRRVLKIVGGGETTNSEDSEVVGCGVFGIGKMLGASLGRIDLVGEAAVDGLAEGTKLGASEGIKLGASEGIKLGVSEGSVDGISIH
jgi:hypothetical protein